jgi:hypothetical protein
MLYWEKVLFPDMLAMIHGERYLTMTDSQITNELNSLARRAINTFKFPRISLSYSYETDETTGEFKYYFNNNLTDKETAIILAWMKAYWAEYMISNADNYNNLYFDSNINAFSPGNLLHNYKESWQTYVSQAKQLESEYYRGDSNNAPTLGNITVD